MTSRTSSSCCRIAIGVLAAGLLPASAGAHAFASPYALPIPIWLYWYACAATLVVSFAVIAYLTTGLEDRAGGTAASNSRRSDGYPMPRGLLVVLRGVTVGALALTIAAGLLGTGDPYFNINMTLFWIVFLLGFTYATALAGNLFDCINPWATLADWLARTGIGSGEGRRPYPPRLGYYPAFLFYLALVWLELFELPRPYALSVVLVVYSVVTLAGAWFFGRSSWFTYGELFSVFFRLVGTLSPLAYVKTPSGSVEVRLRAPFEGALREQPEHVSLVLFVMFMLSSTTFDALQNTTMWAGFYWTWVVPLAKPLWGPSLLEAQQQLTQWYIVFQRAALLLSAFVYFAIYVGVLAGAKAVTRTAVPLKTLVLRFAFSLIPIAVVYNAAHYYTILLLQGRNVPSLLSDPLGLGWNVFGVSPLTKPLLLNMGAIWHTQVALVLAGHVVSVYIAHVIAIRLFASRRHAVLSQLPMLALMMTYTGIALWVLSLPLAVGG